MNDPMSANEPVSRPGEMPMIGSPAHYRIPQPGGRPLVFSGNELGMAMSFVPELPYWYEINVYRASSEKYVVAIRKFYQSADEKDTIKSWSFSTLADAFDHVQDYDPATDIRVPFLDCNSLPPAELAAKAMQLQSEVAMARAHYSGLVGEFLAEIEAAGGDAG